MTTPTRPSQSELSGPLPSAAAQHGHSFVHVATAGILLLIAAGAVGCTAFGIAEVRSGDSILMNPGVGEVLLALGLFFSLPCAVTIVIVAADGARRAGQFLSRCRGASSSGTESSQRRVLPALLHWGTIAALMHLQQLAVLDPLVGRATGHSWAAFAAGEAVAALALFAAWVCEPRAVLGAWCHCVSGLCANGKILLVVSLLAVHDGSTDSGLSLVDCWSRFVTSAGCQFLLFLASRPDDPRGDDLGSAIGSDLLASGTSMRAKLLYLLYTLDALAVLTSSLPSYDALYTSATTDNERPSHTTIMPAIFSVIAHTALLLIELQTARAQHESGAAEEREEENVAMSAYLCDATLLAARLVGAATGRWDAVSLVFGWKNMVNLVVSASGPATAPVEDENTGLLFSREV